MEKDKNEFRKKMKKERRARLQSFKVREYREERRKARGLDLVDNSNFKEREREKHTNRVAQFTKYGMKIQLIIEMFWAFFRMILRFCVK